jgi:uroporphyrin-III C-methyltransferase/precorrin-2 dehydrogenase/sirohydrochlorin ferrochelatase/uroporphyrin-III C-methyltransferase
MPSDRKSSDPAARGDSARYVLSAGPGSAPGKVYLVGAGPGDWELLTLKAHRLLQQADAVIYDRLVSDDVMALVPKGTMRLFVGKSMNHHPIPQAEINRLMARMALSGRTVVRLKGGDPFVFGRGCEESGYLGEHGVPFEVVPGITAASGCTARLGIPLTHRRLATGVRFVTGHRCDEAGLDLDWASLADPKTTLVVYMGLATLGELSRQLIAAGLPADTPAAAIASGTTPDERACCAGLADLSECVRAEGLRSPLLIVIGEVVTLADLWRDAAPALTETAHADGA